MVRQFKAIGEKHTDGYVAYPMGRKGVVVGEGDTCAEALADVYSGRYRYAFDCAVRSH